MRWLLCCLLGGTLCVGIRRSDNEALDVAAATEGGDDATAAATGVAALAAAGAAVQSAVVDLHVVALAAGGKVDQGVVDQGEVDDSRVASLVAAGDARIFWGRRRRNTEAERFNAPVLSRMFEPLGEESSPVVGCGTPLLAKAVINRSTWTYMKDHSDQHFLTQESRLEKMDTKVLFSTGVRWAMIESPVGVVPVVPGMQLLEVAGTRLPGWTWYDVLNTVPEEGSFEVAFQAGYDLRACWGDTITYDDRPVCGPAALAELAEGLRSASAEKLKDGSYAVVNITGFTVQAMTEEEVSLLQQVAPALKAEGDLRLEEQEDLCYRSAIAPICVVMRLPGVCRTQDAGCMAGSDPPDVFWMAQRRVEFPEGEPATIRYDGDDVELVELRGPQTARHFRAASTLVKREPVWHREDSGYMGMFPLGVTLNSCGSREAALTMQLDAQALAAQDMTSYPLLGRFYAWETEGIQPTNVCHCSASAGQTFWPLILQATQTETNKKYRFVVGITDWLSQAKRAFYNLGSTARAPDTYRDNFLRMWPQYFKLEPRFLDMARGVIMKTSEEPAEVMPRGTQVRLLQKVKYTNGWFGMLCKPACSQPFTVNGKNTTLYINQMSQIHSYTSPGGSNFKAVPGDTGVVVDYWTTGSEAATLVVRLDKYKAKKNLLQVVNPPVFEMMPNQVIALKRVVLRPPPTPSPPTSTSVATTTDVRLPNEDAAAQCAAGLALLLAAGASLSALQ